MRGFAILLLAVTAGILSIAHGEGELETLRLKYEIEVERLDKPLVTLRSQYKAQLLKLHEKFIVEGDLEGAVAAQAAADASDKDPEKGGSEIAAIASVQKIFLKTRDARSREKKSALKSLNNSYAVQLSKLRKSLTQARKLEEAKLVDAEIKKIAGEALRAGGGIPRGCVLHYTFDKKPKAGKVVDDSGSGHDGASIDEAWLRKGFSGGGHRLVGSGDRIKIEHDPIFTGEAAALSLWLKLNSAKGYRARLWDKYDHESKRGYLFGVVEGKPYIQYCTSAGHQNLDTKGALGLRKWHHVVFTYDKSGMAIYVDGKLVESKADSSKIVHLDNIVRMGKDLYGGHEPDASVDSVRFFSRRLGDREIENLYEEDGGGYLRQ